MEGHSTWVFQEAMRHSSCECCWPSTFTFCTKVKWATLQKCWVGQGLNFWTFCCFIGWDALPDHFCLICDCLKFYEPLIWRTNMISREMPMLSGWYFTMEKAVNFLLSAKYCILFFLHTSRSEVSGLSVFLLKSRFWFLLHLGSIRVGVWTECCTSTEIKRHHLFLQVDTAGLQV